MSFPNASVGNPDKAMTGPPTKTFGGDNFGTNLNPFDEKLINETIQKAGAFTVLWNKLRRRNWNFFAEKLRPYKIAPYFELDRKIVPGVFLARLPKGFRGDLRKKQLNNAGVEATEYYGQGGFYFPVHQFLSEYERQYILYHFKNLQTSS